VRLYLRPDERHPSPEPLKTDDRKAVLVGTAVWFTLLLGTLIMRDDLLASGHGWWIWTCAAGIGLGVVGLVFLHRR